MTLRSHVNYRMPAQCFFINMNTVLLKKKSQKLFEVPDNACMNPLAISLSKYNGNREKKPLSNATLRFIRILWLFFHDALHFAQFCWPTLQLHFLSVIWHPSCFHRMRGGRGKWASCPFPFPTPPHLLVQLNQQSGSTLFHSGGVMVVYTSVLPIREGTRNIYIHIFFLPIAPEHPLSCANFGITLHGRHLDATTKSHKVFKYTGRCWHGRNRF